MNLGLTPKISTSLTPPPPNSHMPLMPVSTTSDAHAFLEVCHWTRPLRNHKAGGLRPRLPLRSSFNRVKLSQEITQEKADHTGSSQPGHVLHSQLPHFFDPPTRNYGIRAQHRQDEASSSSPDPFITMLMVVKCGLH